MPKRKRNPAVALPEEPEADPGQFGPLSAGQSGDNQQLSREAQANEESVEELADTDQALEAAIVEGVEDAENHDERPTHTHLDYGNPEDIPPKRAR